MKFSTYYLMFLCSCLSFGLQGQVTIVSEGLNNSSSLFTVSGGSYYSGNSAAADGPASSPFNIEGSHSYGRSNGTATLTSSDINTSGYSGNALTFKLASFSINSTGNGVEPGDMVTVEVSPDGGTNWYSTLIVQGPTANNAYWGFSAIGIASTAYDADATPVTFAPAGTGNRTTDGYSTVTVTNIPAATNLRIRITLLNNAANERWLIDDFKVTGTAAITSAQTGNWSSASTWTGGVIPSSGMNAIIANGHTVTMDSGTYSTRNAGTVTTIAAGGTLATGMTYTNNGTLNVNGTFQLNNGGWANGTAFNYGSNGTLAFNHSGGPYGINNTDVFWPTINGPANVSVSNNGSINLGASGTASRTVSGTFQTANGVSLSNSSVLTISGICILNADGYFNNAPAYTSTSTLVYNTGGTYGLGNEWTGNAATAGTGIPQNLTIQNNTTLNFSTAANRGIAGNLNVISGGLTLNATAGDLYVAGNWNRASGTTFTPNNRAVYFNGSGTQTVTAAAGTEYFDFLRILGSGTLQAGTSTDIVVSGNSGLTLGSSNGTSTLDLNGRKLTLSGGGNLNLNSGTRRITSSLANGRLEITTASITIINGGSLRSDANTIIDLKTGLDCGTASLFTIAGTLQINSGGFVMGNSPKYASGSLLQYNSGTNPYNRQLEWTSDINTVGTIGMPFHVQISNNTQLNYINPSNSGPKGIGGNLTIDTGSALYMDYGSVSSAGALTVSGNLSSAGTLTLGQSVGDDIKIGGNIAFTSGYSFDPKGRAVICTKNGTQVLTASSTPTFHYLNMESGSTTLQLSGTDLMVTAPNAGHVISFAGSGDTIDLNGRMLTLGTSGISNTLSGTGSFKGSNSSGLVLNGGSGGTPIGTLRFASGGQQLGILTVNRQAATTAFQLGTALSINSTLTLSNGYIDLNGQVLTLGATAVTSGASANSFIIADAAGSELRKTFSSPASFSFPIGDNTSGIDYTPATVNISSGTFSSAYVGVYVRDVKHPSNIAPVDYITRYWGITASGISGTISYSFTATYTSADINGTEGNSKAGRFDGSEWSNISASSIGSSTLTLTGLNSFPATNQITAGAPLTDAFYYFRSAVNGGNWSTPSNWEVSPNNSTGWVTAMTAPTYVSSGISIRSGYNITSGGTVSVDDLTIENGGSLTISGGNFTVNNGAAATDLKIDGTLTYSGGTFNQNGAIAASATGHYIHSIASGSLALPTVTWDPASTCTISGLTNSGPIYPATMGQTFGNLNWNNAAQGSYVNIESSAFSIAGTLTVGPTTNTDNKLSLANSSGTYNNTINTLVVTGGQFNGIGNSGTSNLTITNGVSVSGGKFVVSDGSGTSNITIGTDLNVSGTGTVVILNNGSSPANTLNITRDLTITGSGSINLEAVSAGNATINVGRDFNCSSTSSAAVDFGTGSVANNVINIGRNFTKSGSGTFYTTSSTRAAGFAFNGTGTQILNYSGAPSNYTSWLVKPGAYLQLASDLTLGTGTNPASHFVVNAGATVDFAANSIVAANTSDPQFVTAAGATLITSHTSGFGGTAAAGSLKNFGAVNTGTGAGRVALPAGVNYTFNGNSSTPFPDGTFGNPATVTVNAVLTSNMASALTVTSALNIINTGRFTLNTAGIALSGTAAFTIASGATFDNNGENQITGGSGSVAISGKFITRDMHGFVGTNTSIPSITPTLQPGSVIEYGRSGDQTVQGSSAPDYKVVAFSGSGTKTLSSGNAVQEEIIVSDSAILQVGNNTFGNSGTKLTMTGASRYVTAGTGVRPSAGGAYNLAAGTTVELTNNAATLQTPRLNRNYYNLEVSGTSVGCTSLTNGVSFQSGGTFTLKSGGVFKLHNTAGFTGGSNTAIESNNNPSVVLETNSKVEYAGANQTITPLSTGYDILGISGTGTKTINTSLEVLVNNTLQIEESQLQIGSEKLLTVTNGITNNADEDILVMNKGNLVQINDAAVNTGSMKMIRTSRYTDHDDYIYFGSPIAEDMLPQFPDTFDASYMWDLYGLEDGAWVGITATTPGRGYIARIGEGGVGFQDYEFTGTPNNGIIHVAADSFDNGQTITATGNSVLLANPYPSAISAAQLISENSNSLEGTLYFWTAVTPVEDGQYNEDDYATWNSTGGTGTKASTDLSEDDDLKPTGMIAAGQGFFAMINSDDGITFNNSMRVRSTTDNGQFFRPQNQIETLQAHRIWLNLTNDSGAFRQMLLGYVDGASDGYDGHFDGLSFTGNSVNIYSMVGDKNLVIQGRELPFEDSDMIPLGYQVTNQGTYTIEIDQLDGIFQSTQDVYLEDLLLQNIHDLKASPYTFSSEAGTFNQRFILRFNALPLELPGSSLPDNGIVVSSQNQQLDIHAVGEKIAAVSIYDMQGRLVEEADRLNTTHFQSQAPMGPQALIVKITLVNGVTVNQKTLLRN